MYIEHMQQNQIALGCTNKIQSNYKCMTKLQFQLTVVSLWLCDYITATHTHTHT